MTGGAVVCGGEAGGAAEGWAGWRCRASSRRHAMAARPEGGKALPGCQSEPAASEDAALRRLPVAALRLEPEAEMALRRAGLKSIGDLAARPATPLPARFGEDATNMLALVLGLTDSRITPRRPQIGRAHV